MKIDSTTAVIQTGTSQQFLPLTYLRHGAESVLRSELVCSQSRNSPHFMEPEGSLPHSQAPATCPCPGPAQSSPHTHIYNTFHNLNRFRQKLVKNAPTHFCFVTDSFLTRTVVKSILYIEGRKLYFDCVFYSFGSIFIIVYLVVCFVCFCLIL